MRFVSHILDVLFPPKCVFCRRILQKGEDGVCARCMQGVRPLPGGGALTGDFFSLCVAALPYKGKVREAILRFKFKEDLSHVSLFGRYIADCVRENLSGRYDLISWVPLSRQRLKKRGFDQAMLLAMAAALELSDVAAETLLKPVDAPAQSGIEGGAEKRRANISGAYEVADPELVRGRRVLLIDDIVTTGSTLSECARMLLMAGAESVCCAALAKSD